MIVLHRLLNFAHLSTRYAKIAQIMPLDQIKNMPQHVLFVMI